MGGSFDAFRSGSEQQDDIAMIEIRYDPKTARNFDDRTINKLIQASKGHQLTVELGPDDLRSEDLLPHLLEI